MSIFFAESYGQKLKFSKPKDNGNNNNDDVDDRIKKKDEDSSRSSSTPTPLPPTANDINRMTQQKQTKTKLPRFALELDGVNCFETIVPYWIFCEN